MFQFYLVTVLFLFIYDFIVIPVLTAGTNKQQQTTETKAKSPIFTEGSG